MMKQSDVRVLNLSLQGSRLCGATKSMNETVNMWRQLAKSESVP